MAETKHPMKEPLILLAELQQADMEISELESQLTGVQDRLDGFRAELSTMQAKVNAHGQALGALKKQYRDQEAESRGIEDTIAKTKGKLNSVKTNKEYQAMLKAIDDLELKKSGLEDQMLDLLDQIEASESQTGILNADFNDFQQEIKEKEADIVQKADTQRQAIGRLQHQREATWSQLPVKLQGIYQRVARQSRGIAMAAVTDGICQACRVNIPPQLFIDLMRMNALLQCPNCQRIMYPGTIWDIEEKKNMRSE